MAGSMGITSTFPVRDGTALRRLDWPVESARGAVVVVHGYKEHAGRYEHLAGRLNETGLSVFAFDLRGHGRSEGFRGHVRRFSQYLDDLEAFLRHEVPLDETAPTFLLGHSLGGLIVTNYVLRRRPQVRGVVLSSPFFGPAAAVPAGKLLLARIMSVLHPSFASPTGLRCDWLSHDPAIAEAYDRDPRVFERATARWFTETMAAINNVRRNAGSFALPCLVLQAGDDRIADPTLPKQFFDAFASDDKRYVAYPGLYHEIFNETEKEKVIGDLIGWIDERIE